MLQFGFASKPENSPTPKSQSLLSLRFSFLSWHGFELRADVRKAHASFVIPQLESLQVTLKSSWKMQTLVRGHQLFLLVLVVFSNLRSQIVMCCSVPCYHWVVVILHHLVHKQLVCTAWFGWKEKFCYIFQPIQRQVYFTKRITKRVNLAKGFWPLN